MRSSNDPDRPTYVSKTTVAMVSLRMPLGLKEQIQNDIDTKGDVKNLTEWITIAIRKYLEERTGGGDSIR